MFGVMLSVFDNLYGPKELLRAPDTFEAISLDRIPLLMDLDNEGFFYYECDDLKTANLIFTINDPLSRGEQDTLMMSIISYKDYLHIDLRSFKETIEFLVNRLKENPDLYKGLNLEKIDEGLKIFQELGESINDFYKFLINERIYFEENFQEKITYELSAWGKYTLKNRLNEKFNNTDNAMKEKRAELIEELEK